MSPSICMTCKNFEYVNNLIPKLLNLLSFDIQNSWMHKLVFKNNEFVASDFLGILESIDKKTNI